MLSEDEAVKLAINHLKVRENIEFRLDGAKYIPVESRLGRYKVMGDTWTVRFERVLPPGVVETGCTIVHVDPHTGRIIDEPLF